MQRSSSILLPGLPGLYSTCARLFLSLEQSYAGADTNRESPGNVFLMTSHILQVVSGGVASNQALRDSLQAIAGMAHSEALQPARTPFVSLFALRNPSLSAMPSTQTTVAVFSVAHRLELVCPPPRLCTDNGVMIAWAGVERFVVRLLAIAF